MDGAAKADTEQVVSGFADDETFVTEDVISAGSATSFAVRGHYRG